MAPGSLAILRLVIASVCVFDWSRQMALNPRFVYVVQEEIRNGTQIGNIPLDLKLDIRYSPEVLQTLRYRFLTPPPSAIAIEEATGRIVTRGRLDREALCRHETVCLIHEDVAIQPVQYFQIIKITINVTDVNDNRPEFSPAQLVHEMIESSLLGTTVVIPTARDADTPPLSVQGYKIIVSDPEDDKMQLRTQTKLDGSIEVKLVLVRPLDREVRDLHRFKVVAYDGGDPARNGSLEVSIVVLDANDNSPVFEHSSYEAKVAENVPLFTTVTRVVAHDNDIGLNGEVTYGFSSSTRKTFADVFAINNRSGEIYVIGDVDHETLPPVCHLIVTALDRGPDALPSETTVMVKIEDLNDNAPILTVNTLYDSDTDVAQVTENENVGAFVGHVIGRDPDKGQNGRFNCSVDDARFKLRRMYNEEYHIVTAAPMDRERTARYRFCFSDFSWDVRLPGSLEE